MRLLIVEDEKRTASYLRKGLAENGFVVDLAYDGESGLELGSRRRYDVLVLDVNLPERDGWEVLRELRRRNVRTPVLFLSARDLVEDKVKGLGLGADDYLVKPFAFSELLARLRTLVRRGLSAPTASFALGDLELDPVAHVARRAGERLDLSPKDFSLLSLLLRRQGQVISRTQLLEEVWNMDFDGGTNVVEVAVRRLRLKVDAGRKHKLIQTVRGAGYTLRLPGKMT